MRSCVALLLCCAVSPAWGQVSAKISGPETVKSCEIVELKLEYEGDDCKLTIRPKPSTMRERYTSEGDRCCLFLPTDGTRYECELTVVGIVDGKVKFATASHTVKVDGQPEPEPNPGPNPGPNPPMPTPPTPPPPTPPNPKPGPEDGRFFLAKLVFETAKAVNRPAECAALAASFRDTAKYVRDNNPGVLSVLSKLKAANNAAIPSSSRSYWTGFADTISGRLKSLYGEGKLGSSTDWADCFDEIAVGLEHAK